MPHPSAYNVQYVQHLLALNPIALWEQDDKVGAIAWDASRNWFNGVYTGGTPHQPGIGDGRTSVFYDGINDRTNIFSPGFEAALNYAEGTIATWVRMSAPGVWTDGVTREFVDIYRNAGNWIILYKSSINDRIIAYYGAGGVAKASSYTFPSPPAAFFHVAMTWSKADDVLRLFSNGVEVGVPQNGLGNWAGNAIYANLGCVQTGPAAFLNFHDGELAHSAIWSRALSSLEILELYNAGVSH